MSGALRGPLIAPLLNGLVSWLIAVFLPMSDIERVWMFWICLGAMVFVNYLLSRVIVIDWLEEKWPRKVVVGGVAGLSAAVFIGVFVFQDGTSVAEEATSTPVRPTTPVDEQQEEPPVEPEPLPITERDRAMCQSTPVWDGSQIPLPASSYVVQEGDKMRCIALAHGVDPKSVFEHNNEEIPNPDVIQPGDTVRIPR
ncbi:MAG: LysM domain-containing protein [Chloroflexota bacterium]|nr:LysM domain-containing protein [Chloroflexota bacterium]MDE2894189.1 LysM domain-containing protein [Chloroflexota bacterium]